MGKSSMVFMKDLGAMERWKRWPLGQRMRASFDRGFSPGGIEPGLKPKTECRASRRPKGRFFHRKHATFSRCPRGFDESSNLKI